MVNNLLRLKTEKEIAKYIDYAFLDNTASKKDIKEFINSKDNFKVFYVKFEEEDDIQKITGSNRKRDTGRSSKRIENRPKGRTENV